MILKLCVWMLAQVHEQMEPPPEMLMSLLPFQKEFLAWAISQERNEIRGGILADEMGMGKTIQARGPKERLCMFIRFLAGFPHPLHVT